MSGKSAVEKLLPEGARTDGLAARVEFSPVVRQSFARLEAMVHDSPHFSDDLRQNLQELASGVPYSVQSALTEMGMITRETMKYVQATGDDRARQALDDLISNVMGVERDGDKHPVTVITPKVRTR